MVAANSAATSAMYFVIFMVFWSFVDVFGCGRVYRFETDKPIPVNLAHQEGLALVAESDAIHEGNAQVAGFEAVVEILHHHERQTGVRLRHQFDGGGAGNLRHDLRVVRRNTARKHEAGS